MIGASGQLGSRVSDHFEGLGWRVVKVSRNSSMESSDEFWARLDNTRSDFQIVVNAASPSHETAAENPQEFLGWMASHSKHLEALSNRCSRSKLFSLSTTRVYGPSPQGLISEESPTNPDSVYAEGHLKLENVLLGSNWSVLRLSNLFGRPGAHGRLSRTLLTNLVLAGFASGEKITLRGPGQAKKDFLPISALLGALEGLAFSEISGLLNVTSGQSRNLADWVSYLAETYEKANQIKPRFKFVSDFPISPDFKLSNSRLKGILPGWATDFDNEVYSLISYLRQAHGST